MVFDEALVLEYFKSIEEKIGKEEIISRELETKPTKDKVISIIGPRRAGKTYYLFDRKKKYDGVFIDFEGIEFHALKGEDIIKIIKLYEKYYDTKPEVIFFDEVQALNNWERATRSLLNQGYMIYISGSSSKLLSKEIATYLRGRSLSYLLLPFSFREFLKAKRYVPKDLFTLSETISIKKYLREYIDTGGFPEVVLKDEKEKILKEYLDLIFFKDFVERHKIKSIEVAKILFEYLLQNYSCGISITKIQNFIKNTLGIKTKVTIYEYLDKLQDTAFFFFIENYSPSIYKKKRFPKKIYLCDTGPASLTSHSKDFGKKMENTVFLELVRWTNNHPYQEIYYFKDYRQYEIDFLVKERQRINQLIQVTYANSFDEIDRREIRALIHGRELFKRDKPELIVITWDYEDEKELSWWGRKGRVKFVPLWKWLLKRFKTIRKL